MSAGLAATEGPAIPDRSVAVLQRDQSTLAIRKRARPFCSTKISLGKVRAESPFTLAIDAWKRRQARCIDNRCRLAELTEQRDRLNFANGTGRKPVRGMPWRTGAFALSATGMSGHMSILPVGDGSIVVSITTFGTKGRDWIAQASRLPAPCRVTDMAG